jgi:hypothetical protein
MQPVLLEKVKLPFNLAAVICISAGILPRLKKTDMKLIAASLLFVVPFYAFAQKSLLERTYILGDTSRYKITGSEIKNGALSSTYIAECRLQVKKDSAGTYYDEVTWLNNILITPKDTTNRTDEALAVKPYPAGQVPVVAPGSQKTEPTDMANPIQDLKLFFSTLSPKMGATGLKAKGDIFRKPTVLKNDFGSSKSILKGNSCFSVTFIAKDVTKNSVITEISFVPPSDSCLPYLADEVKKPLAGDTLNNFQILTPGDGALNNLIYGSATMFMHAVTQKKDGKISQATLNNTFNLKVKLDCDEGYVNCTKEVVPFIVERNISLEMESGGK